MTKTERTNRLIAVAWVIALVAWGGFWVTGWQRLGHQLTPHVERSAPHSHDGGHTFHAH